MYVLLGQIDFELTQKSLFIFQFEISKGLQGNNKRRANTLHINRVKIVWKK